MSEQNLFPELRKKLDHLKNLEIPAERKKILKPLQEYIQKNKDEEKLIKLNFICTHNSRRSQLGQVWAQAISDYYGIKS